MKNSTEVTIEVTGTIHLDLNPWLKNIIGEGKELSRAEIEKALLKRFDDEPLAIYPDTYKILKVWKEKELDKNKYRILS
tara:strand:- start:389 stop:625 length:237 start_codon:yes stop_codon:yes gene_type:complete